MHLRCLLVLTLLHAATASAADIRVTASDAGGRALAHAVVVLYGDALSPERHSGKAEISQINTQFEPHVLIVPQHTAVSFPNLDNTRHQVYSFSAVKRFTTNLFAGRDTDPVVFDMPGLAPIGCNIHDRMHAYVYVTPAPRYGVTDAGGQLTFTDLPDGEYRIEALHPWQVRDGSLLRAVTLRSSEQRVDVRMNLGAIGPDPRLARRHNNNPLIRNNPFAR